MTAPDPTLHDIDIDLPRGGSTRLRYRKSGTGPPLLLLHTIRTEQAYFRDLIPRLDDAFTVHALDLPGHGGSAIDPAAPYDEPYFRTAVIAFLDALDLRDVTLAGDSIGAVLALGVAAELGPRIRAVIAANPYDYDTRYGDGVRRGNLLANLVIAGFALPGLGAVVAALENPIVLGGILRGGLYARRNLPRDLLWRFDRTGRRRHYRRLERRVFAGWRSWGRARALYPSVTAPVTLIYGAHDWSTPPERDRTRAALPGARHLLLHKASHFATLDSPNDIANAILAHCPAP